MRSLRRFYLPAWVWIPGFIMLGMGVGAATLGISDDEAYYWVLAQRPAWGYAYHPPITPWLIAAFQWLFGPLLGIHTPGLVRLPAVLIIGLFFGLALAWLEKMGGARFDARKTGLIIASFPGLLGFAWMMVPDIPLFLGWMIAFYATHEICFPCGDVRRPNRIRFLAAFGVGLAVLSKYSGVLVGLSCFLAILFSAPREERMKGMVAIVLGGVLASLPVLAWNADQGWGSLLYQIRDRHEGAGISLARYALFWGTELAVAGPGVLGAFPLLVWGGLRFGDRASRYLLFWILPAAGVFLIQPLFSEYKPHWALVVWWPCILGLALRARDSKLFAKLARAQMVYGYLAIGIILLNLCFPLGSILFDDPKMDVTNDLYGWDEIVPIVQGEGKYPIIGSRYQTASQAAFAMGDPNRVSLIPRDRAARDEWPDLQVSDTIGPKWPTLLKPVYYVTDNRFVYGPEFPNALCNVKKRLETRRRGALAKEILVWICSPSKEISSSALRVSRNAGRREGLSSEGGSTSE